jgi:hypothetical protein
MRLQTLEQYKEVVPKKVWEKHSAMSLQQLKAVAEELKEMARKCDYFSNDFFSDAPGGGKDALGTYAENFADRAYYFDLWVSYKKEHGSTSSP